MVRGERVVILTFNDIYVLEQPAGGTNGGFVGLCAMIARERQAALDDPDDPAGAVIVCCCGDFMTAAARLSGRGPQDCGRHMVPLLAAAGVTHVVPGNHEFDRGTHGCALRSAESPFCWLCTNIDATRPENPPPSVAPGPMTRLPVVCASRDVAISALDHIKDRQPPFGAAVRADMVVTRGGHRVGLVGFCTPHAPMISSAGDGGALFVSPEDAFDAVSPALADLDAVVALTHMDLDEDVQLARHARDRIDIVLGGHEHHVVVDRVEGRAPVVKCGSDADHLGRIVLRVGDEKSGTRVESIDVLPNVAVGDNDVQATLEERSTRTRVSALLQHLTAQSPKVDIDPSDLVLSDTTALCVFSRATSSTAARSGPCPLADLFCDLLAEADGSEHVLALIQGGALRGARDYPAGHVFTARDMRVEMPTMSRCAVRLVSGDKLAAAFEHAVAGMSADMGGQDDVKDDTSAGASAQKGQIHSRALLHVSAPWRVVYDPRRPVGRRVLSITCDGAPLAADTLYRVIMQQFVARGGDGFHMLVGAPTAPSPIEAVFMRRVVADRLRLAADRDPQGLLPMAEFHTPRVSAISTRQVDDGGPL
ncbi:Bifunctional metallophosphatase/5'-nucleotidase [Pandoravirus quercus]|uniref:Bifunctional metallophosphatase/5'-nucleotidase n=2 Tax=Pandoravirus TaxID=2060084 RepID=A0A2U7UAR1_9VIRU|nr:Bifunctional metallophosphatase/5'-nucleotidase [Pandoravirus quercus]AVK75538.1 Bifunctional metallophosphatase/5'-nucleotidase [Pandoravirus quercus]QBZ81713.1 Metallophosphatase superfamily domain containing protein [Pandoravirus celtis]